MSVRNSRAVPAFFLNKTIETFAAKPSSPISLKHMINWGKAGRNKGEKEEADKLIKGGNFLRTELPTRLSHRLRDLQSLPFGVASHPRIEHVMELYLEAFDGIRKFPLIKDLDDNDRFCQFMQKTLDQHRVVIPELAIGVSETSPHQLPSAQLDRIMLRMLRSRISRRVVTEQHLALTSQFRERQRGARGKEHESRVGVVDTKLNAAEVVRKCAALLKALGGPEGLVPIEIEGEKEQTFAYLEEHLEFMLFELIKNAAYSTVLAHGPSPSVLALHPITVTIVHAPRNLTIRVSDRGGGIPPYGGLPPDPADLPAAFLPLFPGAPLPSASEIAAAAPLGAQRLDIFSFSHMRRYYQHHAALAAGVLDFASIPPSSEFASEAVGRGKEQGIGAPTREKIDRAGPGTDSTSTSATAPASSELHASLPPYPSSLTASTPSSSSSPASSSSSSPLSTGIAALRSLPELTGTVAEQISRLASPLVSASSSSSSSSSPSASSTTTPASSLPSAENELIDAQMRSGIGLPLAKLYAEYFTSTSGIRDEDDSPGSLEIYTMQGWGSDGLLRVPKFGTAR